MAALLALAKKVKNLPSGLNMSLPLISRYIKPQYLALLFQTETKILLFLPQESWTLLINATILSSLGYGNIHYLGLPNYQIANLQGIQNMAV